MKKKLLKIIQHYEIEHQLRKFNEEVFELNEAIIKTNYLLFTDEELIKHITEEISDVLVVLSQFIEYYGIKNETIKEIMNYKIDRQLQRIEEEKTNI